MKKLKTALEDCTAVCILEGFQKQEHMMLVDTILKELGKFHDFFDNFLACWFLHLIFQKLVKSYFFAILKKISGRAEAKLATKKRDPVLSSNNFIRQYFQSFSSDPIMNHDSAVQMNGDANSENES